MSCGLQTLAKAVRAKLLVTQDAGDLSSLLTKREQTLGYKLLLYVSFCLSGRAFPRGEIPRWRACA